MPMNCDVDGSDLIDKPIYVFTEATLARVSIQAWLVAAQGATQLTSSWQIGSGFADVVRRHHKTEGMF